jgi:hypothetical protein
MSGARSKRLSIWSDAALTRGPAVDLGWTLNLGKMVLQI